jgi:serine/threonine-protein kinase
MSPEQLRAETLDARADLFGLGVVLFEALAGRRPFEGEHDPATIMMILNGDRPKLEALAPDVPAELREIVEALLEPDRNARPENASAVLELLDPFVPSPRTRRELGRLVSEIRASTPELLLPPTDEEGPRLGEGSGVSKTPGPLAPSVDPADTNEAAPQSLPSKGSRRFAWFLAAAVAISIVMVALWPVETAAPGQQAVEPSAESAAPTAPGTAELDTEVSPQEVAADRDAPEATKPAAAERDMAGDTSDATAQPKAPPAVPAVLPARLTVVVFPWGSVWINGRSKGSAPIKSLTLEPGRYKVAAGRGKPSKTKTVRLRAGQRKRLEFDLTK